MLILMATENGRESFWFTVQVTAGQYHKDVKNREKLFKIFLDGVCLHYYWKRLTNNIKVII